MSPLLGTTVADAGAAITDHSHTFTISANRNDGVSADTPNANRVANPTPTGDAKRGTRRSPRERLGFDFTPIPKELRRDPRAAFQLVHLWGDLWDLAKGTAVITGMSYREIGTEIGRDRQWVGTWARAGHNTGWLTIEHADGDTPRIYLHTSAAEHVDFRRFLGVEPERLYSRTHDDTKAARTARQAAPVIPQQQTDQNPPASQTGGCMETDTAPDGNRYGPLDQERERSTTRAYARTRENHAHENPQGNARGESSHEERSAVPLARGKKATAEKAEPKPLPRPRTHLPAELAGLYRAMRAAGVAVRWHGLSQSDEHVIMTLIGDLGTDAMARIAASTTRAAVTAGHQPAHHVRAYVGTWLQHAPVFGAQLGEHENHETATLAAADCAPWDGPRAVWNTPRACPQHPARQLPCWECTLAAEEGRPVVAPAAPVPLPVTAQCDDEAGDALTEDQARATARAAAGAHRTRVTGTNRGAIERARADRADRRHV